MKLKSIGLSALLALGASSAFASMNTPVGHGSVDGTLNKVVELPLIPTLAYGYIYDVSCVVTDASADKMPAKVGVTVVNHTVEDTFYLTVDGAANNSHQALLSDSKAHVFELHHVPVYKNTMGTAPEVSVKVSWLASDDVTTPITYDCTATPSVFK